MRRSRAAPPLVAVVIMLASTIGVSGAVSDAPLGDFRPAGSLAEGRWGPTATFLPDGHVLVVGGTTRPTIGGHRPVVEGAELWDPATEKFATAGRLGREGHTATSLPDGRVLIIGGNQPQRSLATARIWDPATASFERAGRLLEPRGYHTATLLPDGRVFVVGGGVQTAEIWDPATTTFALTGSLAEGGSAETATLLDDGRVLVLGASSGELWDPATGEFSAAGTDGRLLAGHTASRLPDGRVLITGGYGQDGDGVASALSWDPATGGFGPAGTPLCARYAHTSTVLPDGRVLVVGGLVPRGEGGSLASAELWDPDTRTFEPAGSLRESRGGHAATLLPDGRVLIIGGARWRDEMSVQAELWEAASSSAVDGPGVPACIPHSQTFSPGL